MRYADPWVGVDGEGLAVHRRRIIISGRSVRLRRRPRGDQGAMAVLLSVVLVAVLLPLAGYGVSTFVRTGAAAELQRAADAGAVAGAASIPLGDVSGVTNALGTHNPASVLNVLLKGVPAGGVSDPLIIACNTAQDAFVAEGESAFGTAFGKDGVEPVCTPEYTTLGLVPTLLNCADGLTGGLVSNVNAILPGVLPGVQSLLPALVQPGVKVTMTAPVTSPFAGIAGQGAEQVSRSGSAKRAFKNVVALPSVAGLDLNGLLNTTTGAVHDLYGTITQPLSQLLGELTGLKPCNDVLGMAGSDVFDLVDPPTEASTSVEEVLANAFDSNSPVFILTGMPQKVLNPCSGLDCLFKVLEGILDAVTNVTTILGGLLPPALQFVPKCLSGSAGALKAVDCIAGAPGLFRAELVE